jgi:hypothetical protein
MGSANPFYGVNNAINKGEKMKRKFYKNMDSDMNMDNDSDAESAESDDTNNETNYILAPPAAKKKHRSTTSEMFMTQADKVVRILRGMWGRIPSDRAREIPTLVQEWENLIERTQTQLFNKK